MTKENIEMCNAAVADYSNLREQNNVHHKPKLGTYVIERTIGKGMFSSVKLAKHTITGLNVAIKILNKSRLTPENLKNIYRESLILKELHHPNIVKLYQVMETPRLLCVVMEYVPNGEVFDYIATHGRFSEVDARKKFYDVLSAIHYAHTCGIVHRDLKAENLLLDSSMNVKLADFSFGTFFKSPGELLVTSCGSPPYAAPEIFLGEPYIGTKADIWSLGVVLYVIVCGALPFDAQPLSHLRNQVLSASFRVPYWLSTTCEHLIRSLLSRDPAKRPTTIEIVQHPWLIGRVPNFDYRPPPPPPPPPRSSKQSCELTNDTLHSVDTNLSSALPTVNNEPQLSDSASSSSSLSSVNSAKFPCRWSVDEVQWRQSSLAAQMKMGKFNEFVILVMESFGMTRGQILQSLERCAYDHLTATYLLLGEKLLLHGYNLAANMSQSSLLLSDHPTTAIFNHDFHIPPSTQFLITANPSSYNHHHHHHHKPHQPILFNTTCSSRVTSSDATRTDDGDCSTRRLSDDMISASNPSALMELGIITPSNSNAHLMTTSLRSSASFSSSSASSASSSSLMSVSCRPMPSQYSFGVTHTQAVEQQMTIGTLGSSPAGRVASEAHVSHPIISLAQSTDTCQPQPTRSLTRRKYGVCAPPVHLNQIMSNTRLLETDSNNNPD